MLVISGDTKKPYWRESTWLAISYMLLAIEEQGLGTVTYTPNNMNFLREILGLPENYNPEVILPLGVPKEKGVPKASRPEGKVFFEGYEG